MLLFVLMLSGEMYSPRMEARIEAIDSVNERLAEIPSPEPCIAAQVDTYIYSLSGGKDGILAISAWDINELDFSQRTSPNDAHRWLLMADSIRYQKPGSKMRPTVSPDAEDLLYAVIAQALDPTNAEQAQHAEKSRTERILGKIATFLPGFTPSTLSLSDRLIVESNKSTAPGSITKFTYWA